MRNSMMMIALGALALASTAQAGPFMSVTQRQDTAATQQTVVAKYVVPGCWIKKTLKYDYNGNLYLKKVRICV